MPRPTMIARLFAAVLAVSGLPVVAAAETWPARAVTLVIPLAAGGGSDGLVRVMTPRLGEVLGQSVIVENVGGVGGMIGSSRVAKATPDGYQFLLGTSGTNAQNQVIYEKPLYNAATDFTPVSLIFEVPLVLMTRGDFPASNLQEFIAYARANQSKMQYGSSGAGGTGHLACALLNATIGIDITHVPYRGGGPAMNDLLAGRIDYQCALANIAMPQIEAGRAKGIAVMSKDRPSVLPNMPTAHEQGLTGFDVSAWNGIFLPKDTPAPIVERLRTALDATLETPAVAKRLHELSASIVPPERRSPAYLQTFVESEIAKWAATVRSAGIRSQQ